MRKKILKKDQAKRSAETRMRWRVDGEQSNELCFFVQVCTCTICCTYKYLQVCTCLFWYIIQYIPICTGMYSGEIPVLTCTILHLLLRIGTVEILY